MASINNNKLTFRHPLVMDGKYGKIFASSIQKFPPLDQLKIKIDIETLIAAKPLTLKDAPKGEEGKSLHPKALEAYFEPMESAGLLPKNRLQAGTATGDLTGGILDNVYRRCLAAEKRVAELEAHNLEMQQASGARSIKEKQTPLSACIEHFEKNYRGKAKKETTDDCFRRVRQVAEAIGVEKSFSTITMHMVEDAVVTSNVKKNEGEAFKRRQAAKRFFTFLSRPVNEGGLGFSSNPAKNMYVGSIGTVQKENVRKHGILIQDPADWIKIEGLSSFHRAAFAVLGYAGVRLSELAGLKWDDIDFTAKIIRIKPNEIKTSVKTHDSRRLIKPFGNVWTILKEWKDLGAGKGFVFVRPSNGQHWFEMYKGEARCIALTHFLRDELERRKVKVFDKPAKRLRAFWSTQMAAKDYGQFESIMGSHSAKTAAAHYQERERLVLAAEIGNI